MSADLCDLSDLPRYSCAHCAGHWRDADDGVIWTHPGCEP
jgi:hypothetical protein